MSTPHVSAHVSESEQALKRVLSDLKKIRRDSALLVTAVSADTSEAGLQMQAKVTEFAEKVRDLSSGVKAHTKRSLLMIDESVKENLYRSTAVTFGLGVLIGAVVSR